MLYKGIVRVIKKNINLASFMMKITVVLIINYFFLIIILL